MVAKVSPPNRFVEVTGTSPRHNCKCFHYRLFAFSYCDVPRELVEPNSIADFIQSRKSALLQQWRRLAEAHPHQPARRLSDAELLDHLPSISDQIVRAIRGEPADSLDQDGRIHGHRRRQDGYSVGE